MLSSQEKGTITDEELKETAVMLMLGGAESPGTVLTGLTFYLLTNPDTLQKAQTEVRTMFDREEDMTVDSLSRSKYLQAIVEETMRIYSPAVSTMPRTTGAQERLIAGHVVPPNVSSSILFETFLAWGV